MRNRTPANRVQCGTVYSNYGTRRNRSYLSKLFIGSEVKKLQGRHGLPPGTIKPAAVPGGSLRQPHIDATISASMTEQQPILVVAGILQRDGSILICQRQRADAYGLQWEFPGGKVEPGEDLRTALRRELEEELAIQAKVGEEVFRRRHRYPDRYVEVVFFALEDYSGEMLNRVFEAIEWAPRHTLPQYNFLEADRELVNRLARGEFV
jgi:8-oxo-dGTP diphosphatase